MAFNINTFTSNLKFGGARNSLFSVSIQNPVNGLADLTVPFMVKAASIPASTLGTIEVPYFGRKVKLAGNRTYENWTVTVMNDEDFIIRNALEEWSNAINSQETNLVGVTGAAPSLYKSTAQITQYSKTGLPLRTYNFIGLFPTNISTIEMNWETEGIEEFTVDFAFDYYEVSGVTGDAGGV